MKKIILSLMAIFCTVITLQAFCVSRTLYAYDDGEYYGKIVLKNDCKFIISTVDDEYITGTYVIESIEGHESLQPGSQYTIIFNVSDGRTVRCNYIWPVYGKQFIMLDGFAFEAQ